MDGIAADLQSARAANVAPASAALAKYPRTQFLSQQDLGSDCQPIAIVADSRRKRVRLSMQSSFYRALVSG